MGTLQGISSFMAGEKISLPYGNHQPVSMPALVFLQKYYAICRGVLPAAGNTGAICCILKYSVQYMAAKSGLLYKKDRSVGKIPVFCWQ